MAKKINKKYHEKYLRRSCYFKKGDPIIDFIDAELKAKNISFNKFIWNLVKEKKDYQDFESLFPNQKNNKN